MKRILILIALFISTTMLVVKATTNENETTVKATDSLTTNVQESESNAIVATSKKALSPKDTVKKEVRYVHDNDFSFDSAAIGSLGSLLPIISVIMVFGMPIFIIFIIFYFIHKSDAKKAEVAKMAIQSGQPIPDYLLDKKALEKRDPAHAYKSGIQTTLTGIGLAFFLGMIVDIEFASIGILVAFVGLGKIIAYRSDRKKGDDSNFTQL